MIPTYISNADGDKPICNKSIPVLEIFYRFRAYSKLAVHALRNGVPILDLIRARYPALLPDPKKPSFLSLELSSICNMKCQYCAAHLGVRRQGFIDERTFNKVLSGIREVKVNRVHIVGFGEQTLHPEFPRFIIQLAKTNAYLDIVTNGQWTEERIPLSMLKANIERIDISVEGLNQASYEKSRNGASFDRLIANLKMLKDWRNRNRSSSIITLRLMLKPSQRELERDLTDFWQQYGDLVMPTPVCRISHQDNYVIYDEDVYTLEAQSRAYPRCYFPANELPITWDGKVALCVVLLFKKNNDDVFLGNINENSISDLWNHPAMKKLRNAHKYRIPHDMPHCAGCSTC